MRKKQLEKITFDVLNGSPGSRLRFAEEALPVLRQDLIRLREKATGQCAEYRATREAWTSHSLPEATRPVAIEQDLRHARVAHAVGIVLTIAELALTFFLSLIFLLNPFFALMLAVVAIAALKAGLLAAWRDDAQPQLTRRRLRRRVIVPSLLITLASVVVLIFTRGVFGWLSLLLLPFINWWLCCLSIGLLGLSAGLFSLGFLFSWSRYAEKSFDRLEREAVATRRVMQQVERVAGELRDPNRVKAAPAVIADRNTSRVPANIGAVQGRSRLSGRASYLPILLIVGAITGGCKSADVTAASTAPPAAVVTPAPSPSRDMELWLDWSLSTEDTPYAEALRNVIAAMPNLAIRHRIARITAYQFGERSWNATELLRLDLPAYPLGENAVLGDAGVLYGQMAQAEANQVNQRYQSQLRNRLASLSVEQFLPTRAIEPPCTDLQGVLNRIQESALSQPRLIFLLTDGHESCAFGLQPISLPKANAAAVVLLLPEAVQKNKTKTYARPDQVWAERRNALEQAAPGMVVIPHFGDPSAAAEQAISNRGIATAKN